MLKQSPIPNNDQTHDIQTHAFPYHDSADILPVPPLRDEALLLLMGLRPNSPFRPTLLLAFFPPFCCTALPWRSVSGRMCDCGNTPVLPLLFVPDQHQWSA